MSKRMFFEYECSSCSHPFEELAYPDEAPPCPECKGLETRRLVSAPRLDYRAGSDTSWPTLADKWARVHRQKARLEEKRKREHGP